MAKKTVKKVTADKPKTGKPGIDPFDRTIAGHKAIQKRMDKFVKGRNVNTIAQVVEMDPAEYIDQATEWAGLKKYVFAQEKIRNAVKDRINNGDKFGMLVLDYTRKTWSGANLAKVCLDLGISSVPVLVIDNKPKTA